MRSPLSFRRTAALTLLVAAAVLGGCGSDGNEGADVEDDPSVGSSSAAGDSAPRPELIGRWIRETETDCAAGYPLTMDIQSSIYLVELDPSVAPAIDSGDYVLGDDTTISLTAPNDAMVDFELELATDTLTITDGDGCRISYRRSS